MFTGEYIVAPDGEDTGVARVNSGIGVPSGTGVPGGFLNKIIKLSLLDCPSGSVCIRNLGGSSFSFSWDAGWFE